MRPLFATPLLLTLIAAVPAAAGTVTTGAASESGTAGQSGASFNSGSVAPLPVVSGAGLVPSLGGSAGFNPNLSAPALSPDQGLTPSALSKPVLPAASGAGKDKPVQAASASLPPNNPPGGGPKAASAGPPFIPPFIEALRKLGVPEENVGELLKLTTPRGIELAARVASLSETENPARRVLLIVSAALREAEPLEASDFGDKLGARFGFDGKQVLALANFELYAEPAETFPKSEKSWVGAWVRRIASLDKSALEAAKIREKMAGVANENAGSINGERAPPELGADEVSARRFIAGIMGKRVPTEREIDSLLGDWLQDHEIPPGSARAKALRAALVPNTAASEAEAAATLDPALRRRARVLIKAANEHGLPVARIEEMLRRRGLFEAARTLPDETLEQQIDIGLESEALQTAVASYPDTAAGDLLRGVSSNMRAKGGKSVEEIARDGVFVYADFNAGRFLGGYSGRDPDIKSSAMVFYVTRTDGKWRIDGYRQNRRTGSTDAELVKAFKNWLISGGIPESDLY